MGTKFESKNSGHKPRSKVPRARDCNLVSQTCTLYKCTVGQEHSNVSGAIPSDAVLVLVECLTRLLVQLMSEVSLCNHASTHEDLATRPTLGGSPGSCPNNWHVAAAQVSVAPKPCGHSTPNTAHMNSCVSALRGAAPHIMYRQRPPSAAAPTLRHTSRSTSARVSSRQAWIPSSFSVAYMVPTTAPIRMSACAATCHSGLVSANTITTSPERTPCSRKAHLAASICSANCAYVTQRIGTDTPEHFDRICLNCNKKDIHMSIDSYSHLAINESFSPVPDKDLQQGIVPPALVPPELRVESGAEQQQPEVISSHGSANNPGPVISQQPQVVWSEWSKWSSCHDKNAKCDPTRIHSRVRKCISQLTGEELVSDECKARFGADQQTIEISDCARECLSSSSSVSLVGQVSAQQPSVSPLPMAQLGGVISDNSQQQAPLTPDSIITSSSTTTLSTLLDQTNSPAGATVNNNTDDNTLPLAAPPSMPTVGTTAGGGTMGSPPAVVGHTEHGATGDIAQLPPTLGKNSFVCSNCTSNEICLMPIRSKVAFCATIKDARDSTGCGGWCTGESQLCQALSPTTYRCIHDSECLPNEWQCSNSACIPSSRRCDGHPNCYDSSDELNCPDAIVEPMVSVTIGLAGVGSSGVVCIALVRNFRIRRMQCLIVPTDGMMLNGGGTHENHIYETVAAEHEQRPKACVLLDATQLKVGQVHKTECGPKQCLRSLEYVREVSPALIAFGLLLAICCTWFNDDRCHDRSSRCQCQIDWRQLRHIVGELLQTSVPFKVSVIPQQLIHATRERKQHQRIDPSEFEYVNHHAS
ncbi:hypothetical protein GZH46_00373, partial [Fragariocoptes setiger]